MEDGWRGIMCIAATPFDDRGVLLFDELAGFTDWMIRAGSHAVSWPLGYSEFTVLAHEERMRGTPIVVEAASGRVPVLIGVSAQCLPESEAYCRRAQECGADAVVCMLPMGFNANNYAIVRDYYQAVAEAAQLPVFIQNQGPPWAALSAKTIVQLCRDIGLVEYVKEEKPPQTKSCQEILDICGDDMRGVCAGGGGNYLIPEMERGISGNFPGAPVVDVLVQIWDLWHAGDTEKAREISNLHAAFVRNWRGLPQGARKEILVRRGAISTAHMRNRGVPTLDAIDYAQIDAGLELLEPYLIV